MKSFFSHRSKFQKDQGVLGKIVGHWLSGPEELAQVLPSWFGKIWFGILGCEGETMHGIGFIATQNWGSEFHNGIKHRGFHQPCLCREKKTPLLVLEAIKESRDFRPPPVALSRRPRQLPGSEASTSSPSACRSASRSLSRSPRIELKSCHVRNSTLDEHYKLGIALINS